VQASEFSSNEKREEIEKADQAFFNQEGNVTDKFNEVDANIHRIVENPLPESTGADVWEDPLSEEIRWTREKTPHPKSEQSDSYPQQNATRPPMSPN
jgi:hypothetical protein